MCGICGRLSWSGDSPTPTVEEMARTLRHRGPDKDGFYEDKGLTIGYTRLSIIDLETGDQPMANEDESVWLVHNGELYNYKPLRARLKEAGHRFRTQCDTEVYVHAYEEWGLDFLTRLDGMFALGLWDRPKRRLVLSRDPLGVKPVYYRVDAGGIVFASELKAFLSDPGAQLSLDPQALIDYMTFQNIYGSKSFIRGIHRLPPGHSLVSDESGTRLVRFWELDGYTASVKSSEAAAEAYAGSLAESVSDQLMSDVPLGSHLSGGMDSSSVVLAASAHIEGLPVFTAFFDDPALDEMPYAQEVADAVGARMNEVKIDPHRIPSEFARMTWHLDEPKAGPGMIPAWFVAEVASRHVRVVLTGHGGDEMFGGYPAYLFPYYMGYLTGPRDGWGPKRGATSLGERLNQEGLKRTVGLPVYSAFRTDLGAFGHDSTFSARQVRLLVAQRHLGAARGHDPRTYLNEVRATCPSRAPLDRLMFLDAKTYLPSLLENEDRISMAFSLEARVPILGQRMVRLSTEIAPALRLRGGTLKFVPRMAMASRLPRDVISHRKVGFSVPLVRWLREDMSGLVDSAMSRAAVEAVGIFNPEPVDVLRTREVRSAKDAERVWTILRVQEWARQFLVQRGPT